MKKRRETEPLWQDPHLYNYTSCREPEELSRFILQFTSRALDETARPHYNTVQGLPLLLLLLRGGWSGVGWGSGCAVQFHEPLLQLLHIREEFRSLRVANHVQREVETGRARKITPHDAAPLPDGSQ